MSRTLEALIGQFSRSFINNHAIGYIPILVLAVINNTNMSAVRTCEVRAIMEQFVCGRKIL
jgi:hypothetical protein